MRDIYNPPPAPMAFNPPPPEALVITRGDVAWLLVLCALLAPAAMWAWSIDLTLGLGVTIGGLFMVLESWFSGLTFLRRHPSARPVGRGLIFLAALMPWLFGLGFAAALMWALFQLGDWWSR